MATPYFALSMTEGGSLYDMSALVSELQIKHEELDSSSSGRDTSNGYMNRTIIAHKHTVTVKFLRLTEAQAHNIYNYVYNTTERDTDSAQTKIKHRYYYIVIRLPCSDYASDPTSNQRTKLKVYTATINFGSQRYNRMTEDIFYEGMTLTCVEM